jgi:colicin import membrane protein
MNATANRLEFAPPPTPGFLRAFVLAVIAHTLLVAALTWGVNWKREAVTVTAEAELWSAVPQQAAPKLIEAPPPPPVEKAAEPEVAAPKAPDADIVTARDLRRAQEKKLEVQRLAKLEKQLEEKKRLDDKKRADAKQADLKQAELAAKRKETLLAQADAKKMEDQRQENIKRMAGLAGATGAATATGTAQQSSGPSPGYAGRIRTSIKPNIVFTEDIAGNPTAEVEVGVSPGGTIDSRKLLKSSGSRAWDEAVLKAIDKTGVLPRDVDGRVPASMVISFRPKD